MKRTLVIFAVPTATPYLIKQVLLHFAFRLNHTHYLITSCFERFSCIVGYFDRARLIASAASCYVELISCWM